MNLWIILFVVLTVLIIGGFLIWFLSARRPAKLDPMNELLIQDLIKLQREHPVRAAEIIARALVRSSLVTRTDLERIGETPSLPKAETARSDQSHGRGRGDDQQARARSDGDQRSSAQSGTQQQPSSREQGGQQSSSKSRRGGRSGSQQKSTDQQAEKRGAEPAKSAAPQASPRGADSEKKADETEKPKPKRRRRPRRRRSSSSGSDQANTTNQKKSDAGESRQSDNG